MHFQQFQRNSFQNGHFCACWFNKSQQTGATHSNTSLIYVYQYINFERKIVVGSLDGLQKGLNVMTVLKKPIFDALKSCIENPHFHEELVGILKAIKYYENESRHIDLYGLEVYQIGIKKFENNEKLKNLFWDRNTILESVRAFCFFLIFRFFSWSHDWQAPLCFFPNSCSV